MNKHRANGVIGQLERQAERLGLKKLTLARVAGVHIATWKRWRLEGRDDDPALGEVARYLRRIAEVSKRYGIQ